MAVIVLDKVADFQLRLLGCLAASGVDPSRVYIIDPTDPNWSLPMNPLAGEGEPQIRAAAFASAIRSRSSTFGVQIEESMTCMCQALAETGHTPLEIDSLFSNPVFRREVAGRVTDIYVKRYFEKLEALSKEQRSFWHVSTSNKLSPFLSSRHLRRMLCGRSRLNFRTIIDDPKAIVLVALRGDQLQDGADLLGELIVSALWNAVLSRADLPEAERQPLTIIADEFQNFGQACFEKIVAEGRRFKCRLVIAHQSQSQVGANLRSLIRNNAAVRVIYNVGPVDAAELSKDFSYWHKPDACSALMALKTGEAFVIKRGQQAVKVKTPDVPKAVVDASEIAAYRRECLRINALPVKDVDFEIETRLAGIESLKNRSVDHFQEVAHVRKPKIGS